MITYHARVITVCVVAALMLSILIAAPAMAGIYFAPSGPDTIVKGDTVLITGSGMTNGSLSVMVIGRNYFQALSEIPDSAGNFSITMAPEETRTFSSGQYVFVILDPGANGAFEIGSRITEAGNITITRSGVAAAEFGPAGSLTANVQPVVAEILAQTGQSGVDDVVTVAYFFVEEPFIHFDQDRDPVTHQTVPGRDGDNRLHFSGTTNMGDENTLSAKVYNTENRDLVIITDIPVLVQDGVTEPGRNKELNAWNYVMDPAQLPPGEYILTVGWQKEKTTGTGTVLFTIPDTRPVKTGPGNTVSGPDFGLISGDKILFMKPGGVWWNPVRPLRCAYHLFCSRYQGI
jgi:hypothetical protein